MAGPGRPPRLESGRILLRPPTRRDGPAWVSLRRRSQPWLEPWEAVPPELGALPWRDRQTASAWRRTVRVIRVQVRAGSALPWTIRYDGRLVGQVGLADVTGGAARSASLGYWVDERIAGRGVATVAVALAVDHALGPAGLHRVEALVRPENQASRRLLARLGFREEGTAVRSLWVAGGWRDHLVLAVTAEEVPPGGLLGRAKRRFPDDTPSDVSTK